MKRLAQITSEHSGHLQLGKLDLVKLKVKSQDSPSPRIKRFSEIEVILDILSLSSYDL